ncbi:MAG: glycosyltransferase family 2 protein [Verrucomicrobiota bacterium]
MKLPMSVCIITLNEESPLARCLKSIEGMASQIVVVDSGSTDRTKAVAKRFNADWYEEDWRGMRDQKNAALDRCEEEWVLNLDADEELAPELRDEITAFLSGGPVDSTGGASFPRKSRFLGRWITHGDWYPDRKLRLFRREAAKFGGDTGHDHVELRKGLSVHEMKSDLLHYSYPTVSSFLEKLNSFSEAHLDQALSKGKKWSLFGNVLRPWWRFFRGYVLRLGFLDGFPGYWIAKATAFSSFVRHSRLYEHENSDDRGSEK